MLVMDSFSCFVVSADSALAFRVSFLLRASVTLLSITLHAQAHVSCQQENIPLRMSESSCNLGHHPPAYSGTHQFPKEEDFPKNLRACDKVRYDAYS